jgi:hypothetical protein
MRAFLVLSLAIVSTSGCDQRAVPEQPQAASKQVVPREFVGNWKLVRQECEPDYPDGPDKTLPNVSISFKPDFKYEMFVEGWRSVGGFKINAYRGEPLELQVDETMYEFDLVNGRLENWAEGEAVYQCGNIFEREK